jgi:hypothetical protein
LIQVLVLRGGAGFLFKYLYYRVPEVSFKYLYYGDLKFDLSIYITGDLKFDLSIYIAGPEVLFKYLKLIVFKQHTS